MKSRSDYDQAFRIVRDIINEWDPYQLLEGGAPLDEFDHEIANIVARIPRIKTSIDAIRFVSEIFSEAFAPDRFQAADCTEVGNKLYTALKLSGLIR